MKKTHKTLAQHGKPHNYEVYPCKEPESVVLDFGDHGHYHFDPLQAAFLAGELLGAMQFLFEERMKKRTMRKKVTKAKKILRAEAIEAATKALRNKATVN